METVWPWLLGAALGLLFGLLALRQLRRLRLVQDLPTSKTAGVFIGTVEVKGTAECEHPLRSHLAEAACVHFRFRVEERWSRTVTESYTDSKGHRRTRTRRESGWKTVASGGEDTPFYLRDETGVLRIDPRGAEVQAVEVFSRQVSRGDPLYHGKAPPRAVAHSDHVRRFHESALPLHHPLYICGRARERADLVAAEIAQDPDQELFLISTRSEEQLTTRLRRAVGILAFLAALAPVAGILFTGTHGFDPARDPAVFSRAALAGGVVCLLTLLSWGWTTYNSLIALRHRVRQGASLIDIQLKRRHDLIGRAVGIVEGLRAHERDLQTDLARLRSQGDASLPGAPGPDPAACAPTLRLLRERYPELSSDEAFRQLATTLTETEQRIALAREYFNTVATHWNTRLQTFPNSLLAALASFTPTPLLAAADFERAPVSVKLAG
jgi:hypothetical protein